MSFGIRRISGNILLAVVLALCTAVTLGARDDDRKKEDSNRRDSNSEKEKNNLKNKNERDDDERDRRNVRNDREDDDDDDHDDHHGSKKVTICHKGKTIEISANAVCDHQRHGDTLGACPVSASR